jgi:predicted site-specific integrase-resolvase
MSEQPSDLMTPDEAAAVLKVAPSTLRRYGVEGRVHRVLLTPRTARYTAASISALINPTHGKADS